MRTVGWPDPVSPGIAPFRMDVPAHWSAVEPDDGLIAFLAPAVDGFRISVLVRGRRVPAGKELGELAEEPLISAGATDIEADDRGPTGMRSVYTLIATVPLASADVDEHVVTQMISSFTLTPARPSAPPTSTNAPIRHRP
jgi:hypothetical protein